MSSLFVYHVSSPEVPLKVLNHFEDIAPTLAGQGITFERWPVDASVAAGSTAEQVIAACQASLEQLARERQLSVQQVVSLDRPAETGGDQGHAEHRHAGDEVRWFVAGRGLLYLRVDEYVYAVLCEKHDLISLPAGTPQWFDAGEHPYLVAIRLCATADGLRAVASGDGLASRFPRLEY